MPKFPDLLLNNNPNAPSVDLNDLQVKGVGIFADAAARDLLNSNLHTEGYLAIMKDTDTPFIYTGGTWTDAANWLEVKGSWEEVAYTGQTAIKYENGVVGIKASGTTYSTNSNLLAKAGQFPINTGSYSTTASGVDALMHLHEGRIIYTTDNSATGAVAMSMLGTSHATTDIGQIGLYNRKAWISGGEGVYLGSSGVSGIGVYITGPGTSGIIKIGSQNFDSAGGIQLSGDTGPASNYHKIVMGGQIVFHGHTASKYVAISRRGTYGTDGGVQISGGQRTGLFAHFAASDPNTQGTYGYLGINVNTPTVGGPAFEVSSSYAKFNSGLHIGDITTTGYAFPTATGTLDQVLKVDANGDLVFGADNAGLWTADTNGITYTAGNVGIGAASTAGDKLSIAGRLSVLGHIRQDANNDGNYNIVIGNINNTSALAANNSVIIGNGNTLGASNATQTIVIGRNKDVSSRSYRHTDIGAQSGSTYIDGSGSASSQIAIQSAVGGFAAPIGIGGTVNGNYAIAIGGRSGTENVTVGNASYSSYAPSWSAVIGRQIARFHTAGDNNVLAGYRAAYGGSSSSVSNSVLIGRQVANNSSTNTNNVMVGYKAGYSTTTGSSNVFLGYEAGYNETGSNKLYISNSNTTTPLIYGEFDTPLLNINGELQVRGETAYTQKHESVATAKVGNSTQTETGTVAFVERYYTAKKDGDGVDSTSYTGAGTRRLFYAPKYNADPTKIESQDNPEGWIMVNTGQEWEAGVGTNDAGTGFQQVTNTYAAKQNFSLDIETNTEVNYISLLDEYMGHKNYSGSAEVTFAVVVIPTVLTVNSGATGTYSIPFRDYTLTVIHELITDGTTVDWGDGNVDTVTGGDITDHTNCQNFLTHTYASTDTDYTVTINGFVRNLYFNSDQQLKGLDWGTQIRLSQDGIKSCYYLSSVLGRRFFRSTYNSSVVNTTPPSFYNCVRLNAVNMEHWNDPYQYDEPDAVNAHSWFEPFANVTSQYNPNIRMKIAAISGLGRMDQLANNYAVDFTNGSPTITRGSGFDFKIVEGRQILVDNVYYTVQSVDSSTQITLTSNFTGTTGTYNILLKLHSSEFTSMSNVDLAGSFRGVGYPNSKFDVESFRSVSRGNQLMFNYLHGGLLTGEKTCPTYPPAPIETFYKDPDTRYISPGFVRCINGSTTISAPDGWDSDDFDIPTRLTQSVDCTNNNSIVTVTSGTLIYQFLEGYGVEIDGSIYEVLDLLNATQLKLKTNFTGTTGTYTATPMVCPPININGKEYIVVSKDTGAKTAEIYPAFTGTTNDYKIKSMGWRIGNGGAFFRNMFQHIQDSNVVIKNVDFSNIGSGQQFYQQANSFVGAGIVNPDLSGWKFASSGRQVQGDNTYQGLGMHAGGCFQNCYHLNTDSLADWDVKGVAGFSSMFQNCHRFNGDIEGWNTESAVYMSSMFAGAHEFNRDIGGWNVSNVRTMNSMFSSAYKFNQDISGWDVGNVRDMSYMFNGNVHDPYQASNFNQDISNWDTKSVTTMQRMFSGNVAFNQPIGKWDVSKVTNMANMFDTRFTPDAFDQDLSGWDIGSVTTMTYLHQGGSAWSIDNVSKTVTGWTVSSNTTNMLAAFAGTSLGHVDLSHWDVSSVVGGGFGSFNSYTSFSQIDGLDSWNVNPNASTWAVGDPIDSSVHVTSLGSFRRFGGNGTIDTKSFSVTNGSNVFTLSPDQELTADYTIGKYMHYSVGNESIFSNSFYFTITSISADRTQITVDTNYTGTTGTTNLNLRYKTPYAVQDWEVRTVSSFGAMFDGGLFETDVSSWKLWSCTSMSKFATGATPLAAETAMAAWSQDPYTNTGVNASEIWGRANVAYGKALTAGSAGHKGYIKLAAPTPLSFSITGTADSVSSFALNDSTTDFVAGGVLAGMLVVNTTTNAFSRVTSVATNSLTISDNIFTSNDAYSIEGGYGWTFSNVEFA